MCLAAAEHFPQNLTGTNSAVLTVRKDSTKENYSCSLNLIKLLPLTLSSRAGQGAAGNLDLCDESFDT